MTLTTIRCWESKCQSLRYGLVSYIGRSPQHEADTEDGRRRVVGSISNRPVAVNLGTTVRDGEGGASSIHSSYIHSSGSIHGALNSRQNPCLLIHNM